MRPQPGAPLLFVFWTIIWAGLNMSPASSQAIKGGLGGSSRFRESISSVRIKQQQQQQPAIQVINDEEITRNIITQVAQPVVVRTETSTSFEQQQQAVDSEPSSIGSVQGTAGVDYPAYTSIPNTKFSCDSVPFNPGMYADESTGCQVYHLCYEGRMESFLCGIGTIFNQAILNCDFWYSVDCSKSSQYYQLNADFGKSSSEPGPSGASVSSSSSSSSVSKTSIVQRPAVVSNIQTSNVIDVQRVSNQVVRPLPVQLPPISSSFSQSTSQFSSSGKVSPPKVSTSSFTSVQSSSFGGLGGKTSPPREQQQQFGILSPGRRRLGLQNTIALESSKSEKFMSSSKENQIINNEPSVIQSTKTNSINLGTISGVKGGPGEPANGEVDNQEWKPYFRSKSSGPGANKSISNERPVEPTPSPASVTELNIDVPPTASPIPANQEPTFSSNSASEQPTTTQPPATESTGDSSSAPPPTATEEVPEAPKAGPPPPPTSTSPPNAPPPPPTEAPKQEDQSSATSKDPDSSEPVNEERMANEEKTTTEEKPTTTTTTSAPSSPEATSESDTTAGTSSPSSDSPEPADANGTGSSASPTPTASRKRRKSKKKRQGSNPLTASSVKYANHH